MRSFSPRGEAAIVANLGFKPRNNKNDADNFRLGASPDVRLLQQNSETSRMSGHLAVISRKLFSKNNFWRRTWL